MQVSNQITAEAANSQARRNGSEGSMRRGLQFSSALQRIVGLHSFTHEHPIRIVASSAALDVARGPRLDHCSLAARRRRMAELINSTNELGLVRAQALIRGHLSRVGVDGARIRAAKKARDVAKAQGEDVPPSPFLPTPHSVVSEMIRVCGVTDSTVALDIGCGDARVPLAAVRAGARRGIGIESLAGVYEKAVANVREAGATDRIDLFHSDYTLASNAALMSHCLDRATLVFVFLLPSDMAAIANIIVQALQRRRKRYRASLLAADGMGAAAGSDQEAAASKAAAMPASSAVPAAVDAAAFPVAPCPCPPALRIRVASWTFTLSSAGSEPLLAQPLRPSHSVQLESAHTSLHLYDLCACNLYDHDHDHDPEPQSDEGHAARISRDFATPSPSHAAAPPGGLAAAALDRPVDAVDVSSIPWGHALNTSELLRSRWEQVRPRGLFVEADLRIKPSAIAARRSAHSAAAASAAASAASSVPASAAATADSSSTSPSSSAAATFTIADVCFAHDAGIEGESFLDWYATLLSLQHPEDAAVAGGPARRPLGLKLDFKCVEAVAPVLAHLRAITDASATASAAAAPPPLASPHSLWLNADILAGPGFPASAKATVDGPRFLRECTRLFPDAVRSVGWVTKSVVGEAWSVEDDGACAATVAAPAGATLVSAPSQQLPSSSQYYTHAHISSMLDLLRLSSPTAHQFTFPLRASLVAESWRRGTIQRLLTSCPWATLTIWTSKAEQQRPGAREEEQWIARTLPRDRTFIDLVLD